MRHFSMYNLEGEVETLSEEEIRNKYFAHWYDLMCGLYEKEYVDENYSFKECLKQWILVHNAWEVEDCQW